MRLKKAVQRRNRFDVKFFYPDGASLRWTSNIERSLTPDEMVLSLREIANSIESSRVKLAAQGPEEQ